MNAILKLWVVGASVGFSVPSIAQEFTVRGEGATTCSEWQEERRAQSGKLFHEIPWVFGYLSARSEMRGKGLPDITKGLKRQFVEEFLDSWCVANPSDKVIDATRGMLVFLFNK